MLGDAGSDVMVGDIGGKLLVTSAEQVSASDFVLVDRA